MRFIIFKDRTGITTDPKTIATVTVEDTKVKNTIGTLYVNGLEAFVGRLIGYYAKKGSEDRNSFIMYKDKDARANTGNVNYTNILGELFGLQYHDVYKLKLIKDSQYKRYNIDMNQHESGIFRFYKTWMPKKGVVVCNANRLEKTIIQIMEDVEIELRQNNTVTFEEGSHARSVVGVIKNNDQQIIGVRLYNPHGFYEERSLQQLQENYQSHGFNFVFKVMSSKARMRTKDEIKNNLVFNPIYSS
jgi:hypothetical protein